jgi:hypothetical protein
MLVSLFSVTITKVSALFQLFDFAFFVQVIANWLKPGESGLQLRVQKLGFRILS